MQIVIEIPEGKYNELVMDEEHIRACGGMLAVAILDGTPLPKRHGKWIKEDRGGIEYSAVCSECGEYTFWSERSNFCPSCGADMRDEGENNDR